MEGFTVLITRPSAVQSFQVLLRQLLADRRFEIFRSDMAALHSGLLWCMGRLGLGSIGHVLVSGLP